MPPANTATLAIHSRDRLLRRNSVFESFFKVESPRLAEACHEMSRHFLAFGDSSATDAQHVSVEFAQPDNARHYLMRRCYPSVLSLSPFGITQVILQV